MPRGTVWYLLPYNTTAQRRERIHDLPQPFRTEDVTMMFLNKPLQFRINFDQKLLCIFQQPLDVGACSWYGANIWWKNFLGLALLGERFLGRWWRVLR